MRSTNFKLQRIDFVTVKTSNMDKRNKFSIRQSGSIQCASSGFCRPEQEPGQARWGLRCPTWRTYDPLARLTDFAAGKVALADPVATSQKTFRGLFFQTTDGFHLRVTGRKSPSTKSSQLAALN